MTHYEKNNDRPFGYRSIACCCHSRNGTKQDHFHKGIFIPILNGFTINHNGFPFVRQHFPLNNDRWQVFVSVCRQYEPLVLDSYTNSEPLVFNDFGYYEPFILVNFDYP